MSITESAITLNFPDTNYFRLQDCQEYRKLQHLREMDCCWYDHSNDRLYLIELKDWGNGTLTEESDPSYSKQEIEKKKAGITNYRIKNLLEKSQDTLCMFASVLLQRGAGNRINQCAPFNITTATKITLLSIIHYTGQDAYIAHINTQYRTKLNAYAKLLGAQQYLVLTQTLAAKQFSWIS